jgi:hypothetical protein
VARPTSHGLGFQNRKMRIQVNISRQIDNKPLPVGYTVI